MKKFVLVFVALFVALIVSSLVATSVNASEEGRLKNILPSGISGKIEKNIAGTPAGLIGFLDRELPNKIPAIVIE